MVWFTAKVGKFIFLHVNINSIFNKVYEVDELLNTYKVDAFSINESKLEDGVSTSCFTNKHYVCLRNDRDFKGSSGILLFLRREYLIKKNSNLLISRPNISKTQNLKIRRVYFPSKLS